MALGSFAFAAPSQAVHQTVTGLTTANQIVQFAVGTPNTLTSGPTAITGRGGADLVGIDYRPKTNELFGVGDNGAVFIINPSTGVATQITASPYLPSPFTNATAYGVDFNPNVDRIRVVNNAPSGADNNNFRFRPDSGGFVAADSDLSEGTIVASAYDQNVDGTPTTTLLGIDSDEEELVRQGGVNGIPSPNGGVITEVGSLGAAAGNVTDVVGFDIETQTGTYYAATQTTGDTVSRFFRLNATTGAASAPVAANDTRIGGAGGPLVESVSLPPIPVLGFANMVTSVLEGDAATVTLTRTGPLNGMATVNYTAEVIAGNTASAGDFAPTSGTLTFPQGVAVRSFTIPTTEDTMDESDETLRVRMSAPSTNLNLAAVPLVSTVNIVDEDVTPGADPNNKAGLAPNGLISVPTQRIDNSIKAIFACDQACDAELVLSLKKRKLDTQRDTLDQSGSREVAFSLTDKQVKKVKKKAKGKKSAKMNVRGTFSDGDGSTRSRVNFKLG